MGGCGLQVRKKSKKEKGKLEPSSRCATGDMSQTIQQVACRGAILLLHVLCSAQIMMKPERLQPEMLHT